MAYTYADSEYKGKKKDNKKVIEADVQKVVSDLVEGFGLGPALPTHDPIGATAAKLSPKPTPEPTKTPAPKKKKKSKPKASKPNATPSPSPLPTPVASKLAYEQWPKEEPLGEPQKAETVSATAQKLAEPEKPIPIDQRIADIYSDHFKKKKTRAEDDSDKSTDKKRSGYDFGDILSEENIASLQRAYGSEDAETDPWDDALAKSIVTFGPAAIGALIGHASGGGGYKDENALLGGYAGATGGVTGLEYMMKEEKEDKATKLESKRAAVTSLLSLAKSSYTAEQQAELAVLKMTQGLEGRLSDMERDGLKNQVLAVLEQYKTEARANEKVAELKLREREQRIEHLVDILKVQAGIEGKRMGIKSREKIAADKAKLMRDLEKLKNKRDKTSGKNLPDNVRAELRTIGTKRGGMVQIRSKLAASLETMQNPNISDTQKAQAAENALKTINSALGADALGAQETSRVSRWMVAGLDPLRRGLDMGQNVEKFAEQLAIEINQADSAMSAMDARADELRGLTPKKRFKKPGAGRLEDMSVKELEQVLKDLDKKGKR